MEKYFVISGSEDGGCSMREMSKEELLDALRPSKAWDGTNQFCNRRILDSLPRDICNFSDMVIIRGEIIFPRAKQVVKECEL